MKFAIAIDMDNAAFEDANGAEVARILEDAARAVYGSLNVGDTGPLRDVNGNKVGTWSVSA